MKPRFLLDEHVNRAVQRQLRRMAPAIEVLAIGDSEAPAPGTSDPGLLVWLEANEYILVTENRSTIPVHLSAHLTAGHHTPGILWIRSDVSPGAVIQELYLRLRMARGNSRMLYYAWRARNMRSCGREAAVVVKRPQGVPKDEGGWSNDLCLHRCGAIPCTL